MIRYLTLAEIHDLHRWVLQKDGGQEGFLNEDGLESAVAQPRQIFGSQELYPTVAEKASAYGFALACNHYFADGNKRVALFAMTLFLFLNGYELESETDENERLFLALAGGQVSRDKLTAWIEKNMTSRGQS